MFKMKFLVACRYLGGMTELQNCKKVSLMTLIENLSTFKIIKRRKNTTIVARKRKTGTFVSETKKSYKIELPSGEIIEGDKKFWRKMI